MGLSKRGHERLIGFFNRIWKPSCFKFSVIQYTDFIIKSKCHFANNRDRIISLSNFKTTFFFSSFVKSQMSWRNIRDLARGHAVLPGSFLLLNVLMNHRRIYNFQEIKS